MTPTEAAKARGVSRQRVLLLAKQGRIPGATLEAGRWTIPRDWQPTMPPKRKRLPAKL